MVHQQLPPMDSHLSGTHSVLCQHVIRPHSHNHMKSRMATSDSLVKEIEDIYTELSSLPSLEPGAITNKLFSKLVSLCIQQYDNKTITNVLEDPRIVALTKYLRDMCSVGEYLLEYQWSEKIISDCKLLDTSRDDPLQNFVYYDNYIELTKLEIHTMLGCGVVPRTIVFIGSGPLPLSSILLTDMCSDVVRVHNLDIDDGAISIASELVSTIGKSHIIEHHQCDGLDYTGFAKADVIFLAALVGCNQEQKLLFLQKIYDQCEPDTAVIVRSAHSLRALLYPVIEPQDLVQCGFNVEVVLHPHNQVVNSIILARRR
ncbi:hypothetical protein VKS41_000818 [Umbelopsis sp. WA50703]